MLRHPHICVCVCTFRRPALLARLLSKLAQQESEGLFDFSVVVVDNDERQSGRAAVGAFARSSQIRIRYHVEPVQNIALARNRAVANADGEFVGFIDDDEIPPERWLLTLYGALVKYGSDGVLGPVLPNFDQSPPAWVLKGHFFDRPVHPTGEVLDWRNTRTGNALLRRALFAAGRPWFDPSFGSGGEDRDLFRRLIADGNVFVWCNEASVYETIPPSRWKRIVLIKRALLRGKMARNASDARLPSILKSSVAVLAYGAALPFLALAGQHAFMTGLIRACDHLGKLLAYLGIDVIKEKYVSG
jgi:succinoglycan biosynthesis protein ExoM